LAKAFASVAAAALLLTLFSLPLGPLPPLGDLTNPRGGLWSVAETARYPARLELTFPELERSVTVLRDEGGVPYIFAETEDDLFFALGFVHAQDRLWQMDVQRRFGDGSLSEVFGPDFVETDRFQRTIGLRRAAEAQVASLPSDDIQMRMTTAYAEGVNAFIRWAGNTWLPLEFKLLDYRPEPWTPVDSFTIGNVIAWGLSGSLSDVDFELVRRTLGDDAANELFPLDGPFQVPVVPGFEGGQAVLRSAPPAPLSDALRRAADDVREKEARLAPFLGGVRGLASNNWAVGGNKTATGMPLLANDPHLRFQLPAVWYEVRLVGGAVNVYGVTFPGIPIVPIGRNDRIAWGATNVGADVVDLYEEWVNPANDSEYRVEDRWEPFEIVEETIRVKGAAPETVVVKVSRHGPLVTEKGLSLALRWTGYEPNDGLRAFYRMMTARDWDAFRDALRDFSVPAQNWVYADVEGNIAIRPTGWYPIRMGGTGRGVLNGSSGEFEWTGFVPFDEHPEAVNPPQGYVASANQQPAGAAYPYYLGWNWDPGYRARRINQLLRDGSFFTVEDMKRFQLDTYDTAAAAFVPFVVGAVGTQCVGVQCEALSALATWDRRVDVDATGPTIWWFFINAFMRNTWDDEWIELEGVRRPPLNVLERLTRTDPNAPWFDDRSTAVVEDRDAIIRASFVEAVDEIVARLGPNGTEWRWGALHTRRFPHLTGLDALSVGPIPSPGNSVTLNVAGGLAATAGPSWRMIVDFGDLDASIGAYPGGQSGNPLSVHYRDRLDEWLAEAYHPLRFPETPQDLAAAGVASTLLLRGGS
jgi:penicillin amidase